MTLLSSFWSESQYGIPWDLLLSNLMLLSKYMGAQFDVGRFNK